MAEVDDHRREIKVIFKLPNHIPTRGGVLLRSGQSIKIRAGIAGSVEVSAVDVSDD